MPRWCNNNNSKAVVAGDTPLAVIQVAEASHLGVPVAVQVAGTFRSAPRPPRQAEGASHLVRSLRVAVVGEGLASAATRRHNHNPQGAVALLLVVVAAVVGVAFRLIVEVAVAVGVVLPVEVVVGVGSRLVVRRSEKCDVRGRLV